MEVYNKHSYKSILKKLEQLPPEKKDVMIYNHILNALLQGGKVDQAKQLFQQMVKDQVGPNEITMGALIHHSSSVGDVDRAFNIYKEQVPLFGITPNAVMLASVIKGYLDNNQEEKALQLFEIEGKKTMSACCFNVVMDYYIRKNYISHARAVFAMNPQKTAYTYTSMIRYYMQRKMYTQARLVWENMSANNKKPTFVTFNVMIQGMCKAGDINNAVAALQTMQELDTRPDVHSFIPIIVYYYQHHEPRKAEKLILTMIFKHKIYPNLYLKRMMRTMYRKYDWQEWELFKEELRARGYYSELINPHAHPKMSVEA
jgi:pentatricopeptide repeat protein